jgi:hypothetical protein
MEFRCGSALQWRLRRVEGTNVYRVERPDGTLQEFSEFKPDGSVERWFPDPSGNLISVVMQPRQ